MADRNPQTPDLTAEARFKRLNRFHSVLSRVGELILRATEPWQLYDQICGILIEDGLLRLALVAEADLGSGAVHPVAVHGDAGDYLRDLVVSVAADSACGHGPTGTAFRTGRYDICRDFAQDPRMAPWREAAARNSIRASAAFPFKRGDLTVAVLALYADEVDYFRADEIALLVAVAGNISYALEALNRERQRLVAEASLRDSELRFRALIEHGADGIWLSGIDHRIIYVSPAVTAIEGYAADELLGRSCTTNIHPDDLPYMLEVIQDIHDHPGRPTPVLWRRQHKDGRWLWLEGVSTNLIHNPAIRGIVTNYRDITGRKEAAEAYRLSAERLTVTLESITDAFYTLDREWRFTYINHQAELILRRTRDDLLGKIVWEEFPDVRGTVFHREFLRSLSDGTASVFQGLYSSFDEWFEVRTYPSPQGLAVYFRDITEQHRARADLLLSEERFRLLAKATNDAIWDLDTTTDLLKWNDGFETLFGYPPDEVEPTIVSWTSRIHPEDHNRVVIGIHQVIRGDTAIWSDEYRFRRRDGSYAHVHDRGHVIRNDAGRPIRMIGGMSDITQRKVAAERIAEQAALLDQANDAISVRDLEHRTTYWNRSAERLYGWNSDEACGQSARDLLYHHDLNAFDRAMREVLERGEWTGELSPVGRHGRRLLVDCRWTLVRTDDGTPRAILSISTDITDRRKLELQFLRAQRLESIGTLAGGIAHDLNNVLAPIMLSIELLTRHETDPRRLQALAIIDASAKRGSDMVRQVLSFARGVEGDRMRVDIALLLRDFAKIINDTFLKNIQVRMVIAADLWTVVGDPTQLHQVLLNLAVNARDAMPEGGTITLTAENLVLDQGYADLHIEAKPGPHVVISVEDTGTGIPPEIMEKIFEPFFTTKEVGKGTGLGLSTSLAVVRSHGGFMRLYSEPGQGTTIKVHLPAQRAADPGAAQARHEASLPRGNGELILVVDDEPSVRQITRQTLEVFGYRVLLATDGSEAVALYAVQQDSIALVLTDMMMPVMDGNATIRVLTRIRPSVRIIASSGLNENQAVAKALSSGVKHFLSKPYTAEALLNRIHEALTATE